MHASLPGGAFAPTDVDPRAADWSARWDRLWPDAEPSGPSLRTVHPDRWVRFHTLPGAARVAQTPADRARVARIVDELCDAARAASGDGPLLVVGEDWDAADGAGGWTRNLLPGARAWRVADGADAPAYFWVDVDVDLEPILAAVIDDRAAVLLTDAGMRWGVAPYDGGVDVFLPDAETRAALAERFSAWRSPRPDGL